MTSLHRGMFVLLTVGALGVFPQSTRADERSPLFAGVPPTRTAPGGEATPAAAVLAAETGPLAVRGAQVRSSDDGRTVVVELSQAPKGQKYFTLSNPPRVVVDLTGPLAGTTPAEQRFPVDDTIVSRVRAAPFQGKLRVVLDLREPATVASITPAGRALTAVLTTPGAAATRPAEQERTAAAVTTPPPAAASTEALPPSKTIAASLLATPAERVTVPPAATLARADHEQTLREAPRPAEPRSAAQRVFLADATPSSARGAARPRVLAAAAKAPAAPAAQPVSPAVATSPAPAASGGTGQRISLDFKDADVQNVLRVLADVSGQNLIATDDVRGKVTLHLSDVPWQQAFDLILRTNRLQATQDGNVVRISTLKRLTEEREAIRAAADAAIGADPLLTKYVRVNYARADQDLIDKVRGVLTERGSVTFDDRTNTVIVRDIARGIDDATDLVHRLDVQTPQVLIESNIVEATEGFDRGLGVQWGYSYKAGPETGNPTGMNFPGTVGVGGSGLGAGVPPPSNGSGSTNFPVPFLADFPVPSGFGPGFGPGSGSAIDLALGSLDGSQTLSARLTALEEQGKGRVISRPRVITMNNVAATIQSLQIIRVKLPSTGTVINTGEGGAAGTASTATEKINTGITLVVTPQVSSDGYVLMNIYAKSSVPDFSRAVEGIPTEISREANSNVLVRSGETVVLGGIYRQIKDNRSTGVPYLRTVPVLGWLFKRDLSTDTKDEMIVFLTPKIIETGTASLPPAERLWNERPRG
jgi:type IV pilus secretin PilQ/predicted competence protein